MLRFVRLALVSLCFVCLNLFLVGVLSVSALDVSSNIDGILYERSGKCMMIDSDGTVPSSYYSNPYSNSVSLSSITVYVPLRCPSDRVILNVRLAGTSFSGMSYYSQLGYFSGNSDTFNAVTTQPYYIGANTGGSFFSDNDLGSLYVKTRVVGTTVSDLDLNYQWYWRFSISGSFTIQSRSVSVSSASTDVSSTITVSDEVSGMQFTAFSVSDDSNVEAQLIALNTCANSIFSNSDKIISQLDYTYSLISDINDKAASIDSRLSSLNNTTSAMASDLSEIKSHYTAADNAASAGGGQVSNSTVSSGSSDVSSGLNSVSSAVKSYDYSSIFSSGGFNLFVAACFTQLFGIGNGLSNFGLMFISGYIAVFAMALFVFWWKKGGSDD